MKELFSFKDKLGEEEIEFGLIKPNRSERDDVDIYYAAMLSKLMNMGVQTKASVDKYYADNGDSALPKKDQSYYFKLQKDLADYQEEIIRVGKDKERKLDLYIKISEIQEQMRKFTSYYSAIYDNTAEVKARDKTIDFCMLNFSTKNGEKLFDVEYEEDFQKRAVNQYKLLDELRNGDDSDFWDSIIDRLVFMFTIWYMDLANSEEEFSNYYDSYFQSKVLNAASEEEEEEEEEAQEEVKEKESKEEE